MTPPAIVAAAARKGLDIIAISDHNSARNALPTQQAAGERLAVLAGMEITTAEEVHVLGIFPDAAAAWACGEIVRATLPDSLKPVRQSLLDSTGRVIGTEGKLLSAATTLTLESAVELIQAHGGLAIAAHVDRPSFSVMSQLGLFPAEAGFDAIEVYGYAGKPTDWAQWESLHLPIVSSSDSHFLDDIGTRQTCFDLEEASFEALSAAIGNRTD
jgi:predicted metal-dependent phosphoesterase TrpH